MSRKARHRIRFVIALIIIVMVGAYYHISNERNYLLHGKLVFPPLVIAVIGTVGCLVFSRYTNRGILKIWIAVYAFAFVLGLAVGALCLAGLQPYLPFTEINLVLNLAISPLPFGIIPFVNNALLSHTVSSHTDEVKA